MSTAAATEAVAAQATVAQPEAKRTSVDDIAEREIRYVPIGSSEEIKISLAVVHNFIAHKTKKGHGPERADLIKFMMLCKANQLNPWTGDAYLIGYDTANDGPKFTMIVAAQALFKRAELNKDFNGIESGVIVRNSDGKLEYREGDFYIASDKEEQLLGGWARVYRRNLDKPVYDALSFSVYTTGKSRWCIDPGGMIVKVAESSALRKAFPNTLQECYTPEEMDHVIEREQATTNGTASPTQAKVAMRDEPVRDLRDVVDRSRAAKTAEQPVERQSEQVAVVEQSEQPAEGDAFKSITAKINKTRKGDEDGISALYHEVAMEDNLSNKQREELRQIVEQKFS